jgi:hypothetical protein
MASSIAATLRQAARDEADLILRKADIDATAQMQRGQNTARAFATLGDIASGLPKQLEQNRLAQEQRQDRETQRAQIKQHEIDLGMVNQIVSGLREIQGGARSLDRDQLMQSFAANNIPPEMQAETFKILDTIDGSLSRFAQQRTEAGADFANSILTHAKESLGSPELMATSMAIAKANGLIDDSFIANYNKAIQAGATPESILQQARGLSERYKVTPKFQAVDPKNPIYDMNNPGAGPVVAGTPEPVIPKAPEPFTLGPGQKRFDASGKEIAAVAPRPAASADGGAGAAKAKELDDLADAVIKEPGLWDQLTPSTKGQIATRLSAKGYEGFGKPLSDGAMRQIADSESAIQSLTDLRGILQKNEQYIGPLAGLQAMNPYSEARKAQADIDLVRQRVGKALEGGVLRKEDEEKYKKILATLRDTPETAIYKVDQLIKNVTRDIENYKQQQRLSGKRVSSGASSGPITVTGKDGQSYTFPNQKAADDFKAAGG